MISRSARCAAPLPPRIAYTGAISGVAPGVHGGQIAPRAGDVHAVAENESIWQRQADKIRCNGFIAPDVLVRKYRAMESLRSQTQPPPFDLGERRAFVQDVVEHQHDAPLDIFARFDFPGDIAALGPVAVAGY